MWTSSRSTPCACSRQRPAAAAIDHPHAALTRARRALIQRAQDALTARRAGTPVLVQARPLACRTWSVRECAAATGASTSPATCRPMRTASRRTSSPRSVRPTSRLPSGGRNCRTAGWVANSSSSSARIATRSCQGASAPGACRANHLDRMTRSTRDGGVTNSSLRRVRKATMCVAFCASAVRTGTDSLTPASTNRRPWISMGSPVNQGMAVVARSAAWRLAWSWMRGRRSVDSPVSASVASGWNSTGLSRMS